MEKILKFIHDTMEAEDISGRELAIRLGMPRQRLSEQLKTGDMKLSTLLTILKILGCKMELKGM